MVREAKRDWESLERKLGLGCELDMAADLAGIPLDEALTYLAGKRLKPDQEADAESRSATAAIKTGLKVLTELAADGALTYKRGFDTISGDEIKLAAAVALINFGKSERSRIDKKRARAELESRNSVGPGSPDLFDAWIFKNGPGESRALWQQSRGAWLQRPQPTEPQTPDPQPN
jgi:hypothetical protein